MPENNVREQTVTPLNSDATLVRTILNTSGLFILARALGSLLPLFLAFKFGVSRSMDAFYMAFAIQAFIVTALSSVAEISIVPDLVKAKKGDAAAMLRFLLLVVPATTLGITVISGTGVTAIFPPSTASEFWRLSFFPAFSVGVALLSGGLNANNQFVLTAVMPGFRPVIIIGLLLLAPFSEPKFLAVCFTLAEGMLFVFLLWITAQKGFLKGTGSFKGAFASLKSTVILSCGMVLLGLNPLIDRTFASWTGQGGVSIIEYAFSIFYIPAILLTGPPLTILLTRWSLLKSSNIITAEADRAVLWVSVISIITFVIFLFPGKPLLHSILSGRIKDSQIDLIWSCAAILLAGLAPYVAGSIYSRVFLVAGRHVLLSILSILNAALNVILNAVLYKPFGLAGIIISTFITYLIVTITMRALISRMKPHMMRQ